MVRKHRFKCNYARVNLAHSPAQVDVRYGRPWLKKGIYSNTIRSGPMLELVQQMLPGVSHLCLNRDVTCAPHKDSFNSGDDSYVLFFGNYQGGELCTESGQVFAEKGVWHRFQGRSQTHWNQPHTGRKYSIVAYSGRARSNGEK